MELVLEKQDLSTVVVHRDRVDLKSAQVTIEPAVECTDDEDKTFEDWACDWVRSQTVKRLETSKTSVFERNLIEVLNQKRSAQALSVLNHFGGTWIDFASNDFLSLSSSGLLRSAFLEELSANPEFCVGATGSRVGHGNNAYIENLEKEIAAFHGAPAGLLVNSGWEGNEAIFTAIPRPGDVIVYDDLIHASVYDGMKTSLAQDRLPFSHNDVESFRDVLDDIEESHPLIRKGQRCVLIAVEAVYSMDGDVCPLQDLVDIANEVFPKGNAQFIVDEAHCTGLLGDQGRGLVSALGLEQQIAVRMHTYGKAMSSTGAIILSSEVVQLMLLNHARSVIYTTAPSFPNAVAIRASYKLLQSDKVCELRDRLRYLIKFFYKTIIADPQWAAITNAGICSIPLSDGWETRQFLTHIIPIMTREKYNWFLAIHMMAQGFKSAPVGPPIVPRGTNRVRLIIHAGNTEEEITSLVTTILTWAKEMYDIETGKTKDKLPPAMQRFKATLDANGLSTPLLSTTSETRLT